MSHFRRSQQYSATFAPSGFSYGDMNVDVDVSAGSTPPAPPTGPQDIAQYATLAKDLIFGKTAQEEAAILEARIANYRGMAKSAPAGLIKNFYTNEIAKMQARLGVLKDQAASEKFSSDLSTATRVLTVGAVAVGILILGGMAMNQIQSARIKQAELSKIRG